MHTVCPQCNLTLTVVTKNQNSQHSSAVTCKRCGGKTTRGVTEHVPPKSNFEAAVKPILEPLARPSQFAEQPAGAAQKIMHEIFVAYPDLRNLELEQFDLAAILTPTKKGKYKTGKNKLKVKILKSVFEKANKILNGGEQVLRVGKGAAYYPAELLLGNGYLTMLYNQYAILCTNKRLLFVNINSRVTRVTHYVFQIPYEDIKSVKKGLLFGHFIIKRHQGKRRVYTAVKRFLLNDIKNFVERTATGINGNPTTKPSPEKLCPVCFNPLEDKLTQCSQCSVEFKKPKTAFLKSLLLPGWGDMYLGHRLLGVFELMGSALVWLIVISGLLSGVGENLAVAVTIFLFYNLVDGLLTYHMAKKGYMMA
jgi:hypothetical protein